MSQDSIAFRGAVSIQVWEAGFLLQEQTVTNKITLRGRTALLLLLAQAGGTSLSNYKLTKLVPGTNNTPVSVQDQGVLAPIATAKHITLNDASVTLNEAAQELVITGTLPSGGGSGEVLTEAGLVLANEQLFARMVHAATLPWTGTRSVAYTWRVRAINP